MYRHFQDWDDPTQERVTYPKSRRRDYKVRVVYTTCKQALRLEAYLIIKKKPRDNPQKLEEYTTTVQEDRDAEKYRKAPVDVDVEEVPF